MRKASPERMNEEKIAPLLDEADAAFEEGRPEEALRLAERALEQAPRSASALHFKAAAQVELGEVEQAGETFERALKEAPTDPELLLSAADFLVGHHGDDRESVERAVALCQKGRKVEGKKGDPALLHELLLVEAMALNQLGDPERALARLDEALVLVPESREAALERAISLFELCRFTEAQKAFLKQVEAAPEDAWAHHYLGLLAERRKDAREAKKRFGRARELQPEEFPAPVELGEAEFDAAVESAIARLPRDVKAHLENATIAVEDIPADEDLMSSKPPLSPCILGVFRGTPIGERSVSNAVDHLTTSIVLYQKNLERFARTREELVEQIGITVMHEVGHLLGLDEDDLTERGLE